MAHILVENGKDFCPVTNVQVRSVNGVEHGAPGNGAPVNGTSVNGTSVNGAPTPATERVSFLIPAGKWPSVQCYSQHVLRDERGKGRSILITSVGAAGATGALVEAIFQS